jgi:hypothetical protein
LGEQQADERDVDRRAPAGVVHEAGEHEVGRLVLIRHDRQHADDDDHTDDVPPDADVVEQRDQADAEGVQQAVEQQDEPEQQDGVPRPGVEPELHLEEGVEEERRAEVDAGGDRHLAEEVEPAGEPRPGGRVARRQLGRPVVQPAGGREARADLGHRQPDDDDHDPDDRPAPHDDGRAAGVHAEPVEGQAAAQDRNDRERDGEVREARHAPAQLLGVAQLVQPLLVTAGVANGGGLGCHGVAFLGRAGGHVERCGARASSTRHPDLVSRAPRAPCPGR